MNLARRSLLGAGVACAGGMQWPSAWAAGRPSSKSTASVELSIIYEQTSETGAQIVFPPVPGRDGYLYGVCQSYGPGGAGSAYRVAPDGSDSEVLHNFVDSVPNPQALTLGIDDHFYGVTTNPNYWGEFPSWLFRMSRKGEVIVLHGPLDWQLTGKLLRTRDGSLYATGRMASDARRDVIVRISPRGQRLDLVHAFDRYVGGFMSLIEGSDGDLYGTCGDDGTKRRGSLFQMHPHGFFKVLHNFKGHEYPNPTGLAQGASGVFYGTTASEKHYTRGSHFSFDVRTGEFAELPYSQDRRNPAPGQMRARDGWLYGVCRRGQGSIYRMSEAGEVETLYEFTGGDDGGYPVQGYLLEVADGEFYGANGKGVYRLKVTG